MNALGIIFGDEIGDAMHERRGRLTPRAIARRRVVYSVIFALGCGAVFASHFTAGWPGTSYLFGGGFVAGLLSLGSLVALKRTEDSRL